MSRAHEIVKRAGKKEQNEDFTRRTILEKLMSCFSNPTLNTPEMQLERDLIFALSRVKVTNYQGDDEGELHENMLKTIYIKLTENPKSYRGSVGSHWEDIGF